MLRSLALFALIAVAATAQPPLHADLVALAADVHAGKDVTAKVKAFLKAHDDPSDVMKVFKPRKNGGLGYGPAAPADGMEFKVYNLSQKAPTKAEVAAQKDDLVKLASILRAVAKLTPAWEPARLKPDDKAKYRAAQEAMDRSGAALAAAAAKGDPAAVKAAAAAVNAACIKCHDVVR